MSVNETRPKGADVDPTIDLAIRPASHPWRWVAIAFVAEGTSFCRAFWQVRTEARQRHEEFRHHVDSSPDLTVKVALFEGIDGMTTTRGFAHHGKGGILVRLERIQRISEESDFHETGVLLGLAQARY